MSFEVDIIIPQSGEDDLGQVAKATITSVRYALELKLSHDADEGGNIRIVSESLIPIKTLDMRKDIAHFCEKEWSDAV